MARKLFALALLAALLAASAVQAAENNRKLLAGASSTTPSPPPPSTKTLLKDLKSSKKGYIEEAKLAAAPEDSEYTILKAGLKNWAEGKEMTDLKANLESGKVTGGLLTRLSAKKAVKLGSYIG